MPWRLPLTGWSPGSFRRKLPGEPGSHKYRPSRSASESKCATDVGRLPDLQQPALYGQDGNDDRMERFAAIAVSRAKAKGRFFASARTGPVADSSGNVPSTVEVDNACGQSAQRA